MLVRSLVSHLVVTALLLSSTVQVVVQAHGMLTVPASRNVVAHNGGTWRSPGRNQPPVEYCPHCLLRTHGLCGYTATNDYDEWLDGTLEKMDWHSQATYVQGSTVRLESDIRAFHYGHLQVQACPMTADNDKKDVDPNDCQALRFVADRSSSNLPMPADPAHPERAYLSYPNQGLYIHEFQLPADLVGDQVLLQWKYITANSCLPPGYTDYFTRGNDQNKALPATYYRPNLVDCLEPYPASGDVGAQYPEQFFNCAEVTITRDPTTGTDNDIKMEPVEQETEEPTLSPVATPTSSPVATPTEAPVVETPKGCCSADFQTCLDTSECGSTAYDCHNCEAYEDTLWLEQGALDSDTCQAGNQLCNNGETCCPGLECKQSTHHWRIEHGGGRISAMICMTPSWANYIPAPDTSICGPDDNGIGTEGERCDADDGCCPGLECRRGNRLRRLYTDGGDPFSRGTECVRPADPTSSPVQSPVVDQVDTETVEPTETPQSEPTQSPLATQDEPTAEETAEPTLSPVATPTESPVVETPKGCCSADFQTCLDTSECGSTASDCHNCEAYEDTLWLKNGALDSDTCQAGNQLCDNGETCCPGLECKQATRRWQTEFGGEENYRGVKVCMKPSWANSPTSSPAAAPVLMEFMCKDKGGPCRQDDDCCLGLECRGYRLRRGVTSALGRGVCSTSTSTSATPAACKALNVPYCKSDSDCCSGLECRRGKTRRFGDRTKCVRPTTGPTSPVQSPVVITGGTDSSAADGCCSLNYKTCMTWCGTESASSCDKCPGQTQWLPQGEQKQCAARWGNCLKQSCCPGLKCVGNSRWYRQCRLE